MEFIPINVGVGLILYVFYIIWVSIMQGPSHLGEITLVSIWLRIVLAYQLFDVDAPHFINAYYIIDTMHSPSG